LKDALERVAEIGQQADKNSQAIRETIHLLALHLKAAEVPVDR
jgi:hypothetical protein